MLPRELKLKETEKSMDQEIMEKLHPDARWMQHESHVLAFQIPPVGNQA